MEPTNYPFRKENHFTNLRDYVPAVNLPGCQPRKRPIILSSTALPKMTRLVNGFNGRFGMRYFETFHMFPKDPDMS